MFLEFVVRNSYVFQGEIIYSLFSIYHSDHETTSTMDTTGAAHYWNPASLARNICNLNAQKVFQPSHNPPQLKHHRDTSNPTRVGS